MFDILQKPFMLNILKKNISSEQGSYNLFSQLSSPQFCGNSYTWAIAFDYKLLVPMKQKSILKARNVIDFVRCDP